MTDPTGLETYLADVEHRSSTSYYWKKRRVRSKPNSCQTQYELCANNIPASYDEDVKPGSEGQTLIFSRSLLGDDIPKCEGAPSSVVSRVDALSSNLVSKKGFERSLSRFSMNIMRNRRAVAPLRKLYGKERLWQVVDMLYRSDSEMGNYCPNIPGPSNDLVDLLKDSSEDVLGAVHEMEQSLDLAEGDLSSGNDVPESSKTVETLSLYLESTLRNFLDFASTSFDVDRDAIGAGDVIDFFTRVHASDNIASADVQGILKNACAATTLHALTVSSCSLESDESGMKDVLPVRLNHSDLGGLLNTLKEMRDVDPQ